jgi:Transposase DDE domain group 1
MHTDCRQDSFDFGTVEGRRVVSAFDGGPITSHAGGLLLGASKRAIRLVERLARCFRDGRDPDALLHTVPALLRPAHLRHRAGATRTSTITTSCGTTRCCRYWRASSRPSAENYLPPRSRAQPDPPREHAGKVALVRKTTCLRYCGQRRLWLLKQRLGRFNTSLKQPGMWSTAG